VLYGRDADLQTAVDSRSPLLLLTGDSGIGKSSLLRAAQQQTPSVAAPPPQTVARTSGALQRSLLEGLADATAELVRERGLAEQVVELAGPETPVVIALDGAEELTEEDRRLLADLARNLPEGLYLRVGFGTYTDAHQAHVEDLRAVGATVTELRLQRLSLA